MEETVEIQEKIKENIFSENILNKIDFVKSSPHLMYIIKCYAKDKNIKISSETAPEIDKFIVELYNAISNLNKIN